MNDTRRPEPDYWRAILGFLGLIVLAAVAIASCHFVLGFTVALTSFVVLAMSNPDTDEAYLDLSPVDGVPEPEQVV